MAKNTIQSRTRPRALGVKKEKAVDSLSAEAGLNSAADFEALIKSGPPADRYVLKLYVTGTTPRASQAVTSIRSLCEEHLAGRYDLEVIDIYQQPDAAAVQQIIAAPTLVKQSPLPPRRVVGNLTDKGKILVSLNIAAVDKGGSTSKDLTQWLKV